MTTSLVAYTSSALDTMLAPAALYSSSANCAPRPAPVSTTTFPTPSLVFRVATAAGVMATRLSFSNVSFGIPICKDSSGLYFTLGFNVSDITVVEAPKARLVCILH